MKAFKHLIGFTGVIIILLVGVLSKGSVQTSLAQSAEDSTCIQEFDPTVDYFPDKITPIYAEGFTVEYFNSYKLVRVDKPWPNAGENDKFEYVLVMCGAPVPEGYDSAQVLVVPAGDIITLSTTQLPHLVALDLLDHLVGVDTMTYVNTPEVLARHQEDPLVEIGSGASLNIELVLDAEPDLVMSFGIGSSEYDSHPYLLEAGIPTVINAEWLENSPLARAEWIKYTALFFNAEAKANAIFEQIETDYQALVALTVDLEDKRPTVLTGTYTSFGDVWNIAGTESYIGQFIRDAGGVLAFANHPDVKGSSETSFFDFEVVYVEALEADFWLPNVFGVSNKGDLLALDERYRDFVAFEENRVYNDNNRQNENGGNDIFESGVLNPQVILADLIKIFHPELLPDHELVYYRQLH
jgi:iron complex transport system substrate-binding protein